MDPDWAHVFPIEDGDIPASYVSLPEGFKSSSSNVFLLANLRCYGFAMLFAG